MSNEKDMLIEIRTEHPFGYNSLYSGLFLPATKAQIEDAMQQARAIKRDTFADIRVHSCAALPELVGTRFECPTMDELNFFAYRLSSLNEKEMIALNVLFNQRKENGDYDEVGVSMKELINLTYGLSDITVISGMDTDEKIGEFVIENELDENLKSINAELLPLLDKAKIGEEFRKRDKGVFLDGFYISAGAYEEQTIYDGETLPEEMPVEYGEGIFHLQMGKPATPELQDVSKWIALPIMKDMANEIAKEMGAMRIEDSVYFDMKSAITYIDDQVFDDTEKFDMLNRIAAVYSAMDETNRMKFKAILDREEPETLEEVLEITDTMREYEFNPYANTRANMAYMYMNVMLPTNTDMDLFDERSLDVLGESLIEKAGIQITLYGAVSKRGGTLFPTTAKQEFETVEEQSIGGMQM